MQEMKYFNEGNDCDICKNQLMTGRDGTVEDCRRRQNGLSCRFEERDIRTCPVCEHEVDREDMYFTKTNVSTKLENMKSAYNEKGEGMKGIVSATFTGIKDTMNSLMSTANTLTGGKLDSIKSSFSTKLNGALSTVGSVMESIRAKFSEKMESAKTAISNAIDRIKGFFNFEWSLPHLKMPHFSISGSFSLNPPSVPSFGVEWYKTGGIMTSPTVFGMNGTRLMVGGEAGAEAILPLAEFYTELNSMLDRKLKAINQNVNAFIEVHNYIDGDEVASRTTEKVSDNLAIATKKRR